MFMRQKRDFEGLADLRPNSGMNTTYQAYFEALLTPNNNQQQQQHPSDKAAVIKYIRRRERRKRAEENRKNYKLTNDILEKVLEILI
jgi:5-methylcytosine-specific restriction endonuclease McrA